jgi:hypothetical protein
MDAAEDVREVPGALLLRTRTSRHLWVVYRE